MINMGKCLVVEAFENLALEEQELTLLVTWVNQLFQGEHVLLITAVPYQIDRAEASLAQEFYHLKAFSKAILYGRSLRECHLFLRHIYLINEKEKRFSY